MSTSLQGKTGAATTGGAVRAHNLSKRYKSGAVALKDFNLEVRHGSLFGLIGPDGAGKTTALKLFAGVMRPSSGDICILGTAPSLAKRRIGYVHQDTCLYPELSIEENLAYQAGLLDVSDEKLHEFMQTHLKDMGLLRFADRLAGKLSGGMKQKLALCCALISEPELILLDEPTTGLDPVARRELWDILENLSERQVTIVLATPFLDEAERCSHIALMHEGQVHLSGPPSQLQRDLRMKRLVFSLPRGSQLNAVPALLERANLEHIKDAYPFADRLEVLSDRPELGREEISRFCENNAIALGAMKEAEPSLENVFVMKLRDLGYRAPEVVQFPSFKNGKHDPRSKSEQSQAAILSEGLEKRFNDFLAVQGVDLRVNFGQIFGLLGANGAGKTTTIKMLCGLMQPTSGRVELMGEAIDLRSARLRKQIGYMSQKFSLYDSLTVLENLQFYAAVYEVPYNLRKRQIDWVVEACDLKSILRSIVGKLPLGWKQRIAFGAAVMHEPKVIFLDEPTAGVDPLARRQLWNLIREFAKNGCAILVTTHYLTEVEFCDQIAFLANHKIIRSGTVQEITDEMQSRIKSGSASNDSLALLEEAFIQAAKQTEEE